MLTVDGSGFPAQRGDDDAVWLVPARGSAVRADHACKAAVWSEDPTDRLRPQARQKKLSGARTERWPLGAGAVADVGSAVTRVFFLALLFLVAILPREPWSGAARLQVASARALVSHGNLDLAGRRRAARYPWVRDGRRYALVPLGPTLLLAPVELPLLFLGHSERSAQVARLIEALATAATAALLCSLFFSMVLSSGVLRSGARPRTAALLTAALAASTTIAVYARVPDGSIAAALLLLYGVDLAQRTPSARVAARLGAVAAGLVLFDLTPAALLLLGWAALFRRARRELAWALPSLAAGVALALLHQRWIGAQPQPPGDLLQGLDGLLLSTGKSLFAYSPPLLLAALALPWLWRTRRAEAVLLSALAAAIIIPAAGLERWHDDPAWGPRRLVALVPPLLLPVGPWLDAVWPRLRAASRASVALLFAAGLAVQVLGAAFPPETYLRIATVVKNGSGANGWFGESDQTHFMPQFSPLVGHAWLLSHLARHDKKLDVSPPWSLIAPSTPRLDAEWPRVRLDWWALSMSRDTVKK